MPAGLALIGVPTNSSGTVDGVARAPAVLRQRGLAAALAHCPRFIDAGDLLLPAPQPARSASGLLAEDALGLNLRLLGVLPRIHATDVIAVGPRDTSELAAAGIPTLDGRLQALIRPPELTADRYAAALAGLPTPWWLHTDLDALATTELAAVDYPQPGGLTWNQLTDTTSAALATHGCAGWSVCIYNPDPDPGRDSADNIIATSPRRSPPPMPEHTGASRVR